MNCSLKYFFDDDLNRSFFLPLSEKASIQLTELQQVIDDREWDPNLNDSWSYNWGPDFTSKKAYKYLHGSIEASPFFRWT